MGKQIKTLRAKAGKQEYDIYIGNDILDIAHELHEIKVSDKIGIIISSKVYDLHRAKIDRLISGFSNPEIFQFDDSEENKSFSKSEFFLNKLIENGFSRKSVLLSIGGGVTGDFTGFIASVYMRGIKFIHIPTTLLAMVDSSIGGKVAVNLSKGKNIAGAFHQPACIISDIEFLSTLPEAEIKNGLTEAMKHGFIGEKNTYEIFDKYDSSTIKEHFFEIVTLSASYKSSIVEKDVEEKGLRAILNFGHTIGHAIESSFEFSGISHGRAVAIGMKGAALISNRIGMLESSELEKIISLIEKYSLCGDPVKGDRDRIVHHMSFDKKNSAGRINFVLLKKIFHPEINVNVDREIIIKTIEEITG